MLSIGGGNEGRYVADVAVNIDEEFYNLVDPGRREDETLRVVVGGQAGAYPARQCVDLDSVLEAGRCFAEGGKLSDSLSWKKG